VPVSFPVAAILFLLTFVLGVPTAAWFAVKVLRKPIAVTLGLSLMILLGVVGPFAGPFGLPTMVAWGVAWAFSVTFGYAFAMVTANAWSAALAAADRIRVERDGERGLERE
jgi:MFS family permease